MNPDSSDLHYIMEKILILDFGSQYTQLIARRVRELNVYCEIHPFNKIPVPDASVRGVILSGSPFSVRDEHAPAPDLSAIKGKLPLLGVCYGAQFLASAFGGEVQPAPSREYGRAVLTVGDDIAWLRIGKDGRLWAVNPENGFFGVAPGTSMKSNPNALISTHKDTIFTNVALDLSDNTVWWEGLNKTPPARAIDWRGRPWTPQSPEKAAHPNSRFTAPARNCPCLSPEFDNPEGVPISAIIFGGRRAKTAPLVYQSFNWQHGVFVGSIMASETTAAATGQVGVVRRDPMAMLPFCGYHMGDYWQHWLDMGKKIPHPPKIFNVNWFRTDDEGHFAWPGFGDNMRVLQWIISRADDEIGAAETALGYEPNTHDIDMEGLEMSMYDMRRLLSVDRDLWLQECSDARAYYEKIGKVPEELYEELDALEMRLNRGYKRK